MAQLQDFYNLVGQLFTVAQNLTHSTPSLLLRFSMTTPTSNDEDLFSGPLSSSNLKLLHWNTHPDSKQGLATPHSASE